MPCTSVLPDQELISRNYCYTRNGLMRYKPQRKRGEKAAHQWPYMPSSERTVMIVFHALI